MSYDSGQPPQQPPYGQPPYGQPPQGQPPYGQPETSYGQPPYGQTPSYGQPQYGSPPAQKRSLRWLWITLGILVAVLVLGCGGCALLGGVGAFQLFNTVAKPVTVATSYYDAVKKQDYATAYKYLKIDTLTVGGQESNATEPVFAQVAKTFDDSKGKVTDYTITNTSVNNSTATINVTVKRGSKSYPVVLTLQQSGDDWKIVGFDNI